MVKCLVPSSLRIELSGIGGEHKRGTGGSIRISNLERSKRYRRDVRTVPDERNLEVGTDGTVPHLMGGFRDFSIDYRTEALYFIGLHVVVRKSN